MRTIAIGDIHGCAAALRALLAAIEPQPDDVLVTLGDYVDRGPASREVLDELIRLRERCQLVPLLGNHEVMFLDARDDRDGGGMRQFWLTCGGQATLASYGGDLANVPRSHWRFLEACRRYYETDEHFCVHANYVAELPLAEQPEEALFWEHLLVRIPPRHVSGKAAVVGHTPQAGGKPFVLAHLRCIDTYCCGGGWLTALDVASGRIWQANQQGQVRTA